MPLPLRDGDWALGQSADRKKNMLMLFSPLQVDCPAFDLHFTFPSGLMAHFNVEIDPARGPSCNGIRLNCGNTLLDALIFMQATGATMPAGSMTVAQFALSGFWPLKAVSLEAFC